MEEQNKEEPKKPWDDSIQYEYDSAMRKEEIFKATLEYFNTNEKAKKYLEQFNPDTLPGSLSSYAWQKARWLVQKDYDEYWNDWALLQDKHKAEECVSNIQQRKLFEKQCEWRAEQFTHPTLEVVDDFKYWEYNVLNCPFIDPITPEDVELYIEFMNTYFGENLAFLAHWQDYDTYCTDRITVVGQMHKAEEDEEDDNEENNEEDFYDEEEDDDDEKEIGKLMPPWYLFWDERRGAGNYRMLTDVRKPKELVYIRLAHEEEHKIALEKQKVNPPDTRKYFNLFKKEDLISFIQQYENPTERDEILKAYEVNQRIWWDEEEENAMYWVKEAWDDLGDCWEKFPIAPNITDWKEALIQTAKNWQHQKLIRLIPIAYDEYLFRMETGIEQPYNREQAEHYRGFADRSKASILRGRELMGEPRDLDF